jgi:hypothetical protein
MLSPKLLYMGDDQKYEYLCSSFRYETDNAWRATLKILFYL